MEGKTRSVAYNVGVMIAKINIHYEEGHVTEDAKNDLLEQVEKIFEAYQSEAYQKEGE